MKYAYLLLLTSMMTAMAAPSVQAQGRGSSGRVWDERRADDRSARTQRVERRGNERSRTGTVWSERRRDSNDGYRTERNRRDGYSRRNPYSRRSDPRGDCWGGEEKYEYKDGPYKEKYECKDGKVKYEYKNGSYEEKYEYKDGKEKYTYKDGRHEEKYEREGARRYDRGRYPQNGPRRGIEDIIFGGSRRYDDRNDDRYPEGGLLSDILRGRLEN